MHFIIDTRYLCDAFHCAVDEQAYSASKESRFDARCFVEYDTLLTQTQAQMHRAHLLFGTTASKHNPHDGRSLSIAPAVPTACKANTIDTRLRHGQPMSRNFLTRSVVDPRALIDPCS